MNYRGIYDRLIYSRKALNRIPGSNIYENHHIIPSSLGGDNSLDNLVLLTPREHYLAHWMLCKIYTGSDKSKMVYAFHCMSRNNPHQGRTFKARDYERCKLYISKFCTGENHPSFGKIIWNTEDRITIQIRQTGSGNSMYGKTPWNKGLTTETSDICRGIGVKLKLSHKLNGHPCTGRKWSQESKLKASISATGKQKSVEHRINLSKSLKGNIRTLESIRKTADALRGRTQPTFVCPNCNKVGKSPAMFRWHFNNCKYKG